MMKFFKANEIFSIRMILVKQSQHQHIVIGDSEKSYHSKSYNRFHIWIESKIPCIHCRQLNFIVQPWFYFYF